MPPGATSSLGARAKSLWGRGSSTPKMPESPSAPDPGLPAPLLRRPAADARSGRASIDLHGRPGAWPPVGGYGAKAHLGTIRHRSEVVEYRVEQHLERLGDRL
jgi:hypothetical protein